MSIEALYNPETHIPKQTSKPIPNQRHLNPVPTYKTPQEQQLAIVNEQIEIDSKERQPLSYEDAEIVAHKLSRRETASGMTAIVLVLEQMGILPNETDAAGSKRRSEVFELVAAAEQVYESEYFRDDGVTRRRLDLEKLESLYDSSYGAETDPLIISITRAANAEKDIRRKKLFLEADRLARLLYLATKE